MQWDRSVSAADSSGMAIAVPGGPSLPVSAAGCVALARAVIGEVRLLRGEAAAVPRDEPACWVRAAAEPAVAAWLEAVRRRGEIAIGYDIAGPSKTRAPKLNPKKSERVKFAAGDRVVVLADA